MPKLRWIAAIAISSLFPLPVLAWTSSGPPLRFEGEVAGVATDPTNPKVVYASDGNGFFRSDDAGSSWSVLNSTAMTNVLVVDPSNPVNLYVGQLNGGILRSIDGGHTWESADEGITCASISSIAVSRSSPNVLYATSENVSHTPEQCGSFFRSDDFGAHWSGTDYFSDFVAIDPANPDIAYVSGGDPEIGLSLSRTGDGGASWQPLHFSLAGHAAFAVDPADAAHVYAIGTLDQEFTHSALYESHDRGDSWQLLANSGALPWLALVVDPGRPNVLFASTSGTVFGGGWITQSEDGGHVWKEAGLSGQAYILVIDSKGQFVHASLAGGGVFDQPLRRRSIVPLASSAPPLPRVQRQPAHP